MSKTFLRKKRVAGRYDIDERTVDRWTKDGRLPPPTYRGRIPLWDETELDERDREATIERASRKPATEASAETAT
jgi:predicted site-specific integrase-resolvase